jgi:protein TonB
MQSSETQQNAEQTSREPRFPWLTRENRIPFALLLSFSVGLCCLGAGVAGMMLPATGVPNTSTPPNKPVTVQLVHVELQDNPITEPPEPSPIPESLPAPPAAPQLVSTPSLLALPAIPEPALVAQPSPAVAFSVPTTGASGTTSAEKASSSAPRSQGQPTRVTAKYGASPGGQPKPDYPLDSRMNNQEGTVTIRFRTDQTGKIVSVSIWNSSGYRALDRSALEAISKKWRWPDADAFIEVPITFKLTDR